MNWKLAWKLARPVLKELGKLAVEKMHKDQLKRLRAREERLESKFRREIAKASRKRMKANDLLYKSCEAGEKASKMEVHAK